MTTTEQATAGALRLARSAAIAETGVLGCPYPADATGVRSAARRAWLGEYLRLRPPAPGAVDYGDAVTALAHGPDDANDGGRVADRPEPDLFAAATQETDRSVDDAGDVILEAGWVPPVRVRDITEAGSDRKLRAYWVRGAGAAKIGWNTDGDFTRCVAELGEHVTDPKGLCAEYHKAATGQWPGKNAKH